MSCINKIHLTYFFKVYTYRTFKQFSLDTFKSHKCTFTFNLKTKKTMHVLNIFLNVSYYFAITQTNL